ncbi:MAG: hypothetical protein H7Y20_14720 [Bryobacteraceae bacterium]|nr:hypothetical protein [Bryobacteraceae bacterium]
MPFKILSLVLLAATLYAAAPSCPAGMPLGSIELTVKRTSPVGLPIHRIGQIEEGDQIFYAPSLKPGEKRRGSVALVLVSAARSHDFVILESKDARKPAHWTAPFHASLAVYVYGPSGLSASKLKGFLAKDEELIAQLADYAEKTAQTEAVLQAIATDDSVGHTESLGAALQGFAAQYGVSNKIDRSASGNDQTLAALRTLNPALAVYDPISPSGAQRVSQTASLAATVAGMFLGSTFGLAAGSTAMALNLKALMFPDTDFRSAYSQPAKSETIALCTAREPQKSRKRIGYLWALRIPATGPPTIGIEGPNHIPAGLRTPLKLSVSDAEWKLISRLRNWTLQPEAGPAIAVKIAPLAEQHGIDINLSEARLAPGKYRLTALWDWDPVQVQGDIFIDSLGVFSNARIAPESANRLQQHSGKQLVTLQGTDFQFLQKVELINVGDKYATPAPVPFSLPQGPGRGHQGNMELQIDTTAYKAGDYALVLYQRDGRPHKLSFKVLPEPPKLQSLPLTVNQGQTDLLLKGEGLDRITDLSAAGMHFELEPYDAKAMQRVGHVRRIRELTEGSAVDLSMSVKDYAQPLLFANALAVAGPRPRILEARPSLPSDLRIDLRPAELPAGTHIGIMMRVAHSGPEPSIELSCKDSGAAPILVQAGTEKNEVKLQRVQGDTLFLSFDPGTWPGDCALVAVLHSRSSGKSEPTDLGRVVRLPAIDSFQLTDEPSGPGTYFGILTGSYLELIGKVGWTADAGTAVSGLPVPVAGEGGKQSLKIQLPWPSPSPRAPLFLWFRGEEHGRATRIRH